MHSNVIKTSTIVTIYIYRIVLYHHGSTENTNCIFIRKCKNLVYDLKTHIEQLGCYFLSNVVVGTSDKVTLTECKVITTQISNKNTLSL